MPVNEDKAKRMFEIWATSAWGDNPDFWDYSWDGSSGEFAVKEDEEMLRGWIAVAAFVTNF